MDKTIYLDEKYSTTRLLTKEKPTLETNAEDKLETVLFLPEGERRQGEGGLRTKGYFKKLYENKPLITVVTVVFNGEKYLEKTIQSIINQDYDNVEYVIIDGGSTDNTIEIIERYENQIDYWVSEKDKGIYDAMNKGARSATGDYIAYMNADDYYYRDDILSAVSMILAEQRPGVLYGDILLLKDKGLELEKAHKTGRKFKFYPLSLHWIWIRMLFCHQAAFVSTQHLRQKGGFDTSFNITADYDFFIYLYRMKVSFTYFPEVISVFRHGGVSTMDMKQLENEYDKARKKNNWYIALVVPWLQKTLRAFQ